MGRNTEATTRGDPTRKRYVRVVGPRLRILLLAIFSLVALLGANSAYLVSVTLLEWARGLSYQNYFYQYMFLAHLVLGLLLVLPFVVFGIAHLRNAYNRPNRRAVRVGYALLAVAVALLGSGVGLMRLDFFSVRNPVARSALYGVHVAAPLAVAWLYVLHRLAGPRIRWRIGRRWAVTVAAVVLVGLYFNSRDPRGWNVQGPKEGEKYFLPSLARTASGNFIPARTLMMDQYCMECHKDTYENWFHSAHHFSSFNNKPYLFSVRETRAVSLKRDGNLRAARWCAGCHDPVPFFSGAFDGPEFDDQHDPTSQAGITCTTCHAITHVNSTRGNADFTIDEPVQYPFAFSNNAVLKFINRQLIKAKPEMHKQTFLKPLHRSAEFCSTCHKVSIPRDLNHYKDFLRGQNHYDTFLLSGVSGHGARSFYYPEQGKENCAACHMPPLPSHDFGARFFDAANPKQLMVHDHFFPGGNTGVPFIRGDVAAVKREQDFVDGVVRVDIFGVKEGGAIDSPLTAPLRPVVPALKPGITYLIEVAVRTLGVGHPLTQGTVDSNELWLDVTARRTGANGSEQQGKAAALAVVGRSGGLEAFHAVDPWAHFINVYMLDREGRRIDRRNPQDIFTPLYDHQVPPGAARVVHYSLTVPPAQQGPLALEVKLQYRKFDTTYMQYVFGPGFDNNLPITTLAADRVVFPVGEQESEGRRGAGTNAPATTPLWQRWNDYGIGLLLEGEKGSEKGELIQAEAAFAQVEALGRYEGPVNLARAYIKEGRLQEAVETLRRASAPGKFDPAPPPWTIAWLSGLVDKQNGFLDQAIAELRSVVELRSPELDRRHFDFGMDYEVLTELGQALVERAKEETGDANRARRDEFLRQARDQFEKVLVLDSENVSAHFNLGLIYSALGDETTAAEHRALHDRYRPDDNARDRAVTIARRSNPAADHAAQSIVIYSLQRHGAPGLAAAEAAAAGASGDAGAGNGLGATRGTERSNGD